MTEPSVEAIVAEWQDAYDRDVNHPLRDDEVAAIVASWRKQRAVLLLLQQSLSDEVRYLGFHGRIAAALKDKP